MKKAYYQEYFHYEREHWYFRARNKILLSFIRKLLNRSNKNKPLQILNVGVATGNTSILLKEFGDVTSIEFDEDCYTFVKNNVEDIGLQLGSILELKFADNSFDLVCAFDVVEHVREDELAVSELKRVCKENAHVVLTVPAFMSLWSNHDVINQHIKRYRKSEIVALFGGKSNMEYYGYFNFWLFPFVCLVRGLKRLFSNANKSSFKDETESDLTILSKPGLTWKILYSVFASESRRIEKGKTFPFGVSIIACWKTPGSS